MKIGAIIAFLVATALAAPAVAQNVICPTAPLGTSNNQCASTEFVQAALTSSGATYAPLASPTFTGTVTIPTPFTLGATSVTSTGTQLNYLSAATGTTGTTSTNVVFSTSPTLVTPTLGVASATTINKVMLTTPATGSTLTIADGKTLTLSNTLTYTGTDGSSVNFGAGGTVLYGNQTITLSGDVTGSGTTAITTVATNLPTGVTVAGTLLHTNIAAPSTPASGKDIIWTDSTDLRFHDKNASGIIGTTVVADTGASNNFLTAISAAGAISKAQPSCSSLSNGASGCSTATGTSGATIPLLNGTNTWSGVQSFGDGTASIDVIINGNDSGTGGGAAELGKNNGSNAWCLGNTSWCQGSTYGTPIQIYTFGATFAILASGSTSCSSGLQTSSVGVLSCVVSSARFKEDILPVSDADALAVTLALEPSQWTYRLDAPTADAGQKAVGLIAEQTASVDPRLVGYDADNKPFVIRTDRVIGELVGAVRALQTQINELRNHK